jgi:hypothetical protein
LDFLSDRPFRGVRAYDAAGGRHGGWRRPVVVGGGASATTDAVQLLCLRWLAKNQKADGSWESGEPDLETAVTATSLLAFLGAGYSHLSKETYDEICYGDVVRKSLQFLIGRQDAGGAFTTPKGLPDAYSHVLAALALSEAYSMTGSMLFKENARKAIDHLAAAPLPDDEHVLAWTILAFKSAQLGGLALPKSAIEALRAKVESLKDDATGVKALLSLHIDYRKAASLPEWKDREIDFTRWYFATQTNFLQDGPEGAGWKRWSEKVKEAVLKAQEAEGAWAPADAASRKGGKAYATAINALTLEVYYRYPYAFGRQK